MDSTGLHEDERRPLLTPPVEAEEDRTTPYHNGKFVGRGQGHDPRYSPGYDPHRSLSLQIHDLLVCHMNSRKKKESSEQSRTTRTMVVLPLVVVSYFLGYIPSMVVVNPLIYDVVAKEHDFQVNTSSEKPCGSKDDNVTGNTTAIKIQEEIERQVATIELHLHLATFIVAAFPILVLGPYTDRFGRKAGFLLPITGTLLKQIVYIVVVQLELSLSFLYLAHALEALGGSFAAMLSAMFATTSDLTRSGKGRSGWIAGMEALQTLSASLGQVLVAQMMRQGYLFPLAAALVMCCLSFLFVVLGFPNSITEQGCASREVDTTAGDTYCENEHQSVPSTKGACTLFQSAWRTLTSSASLYTNKQTVSPQESHPSRVLLKRRLCLLIFILTVAVSFSSSGVTSLFQMKSPLCWSASKVYTFNGLRIFLSWITILPVLALFQGFFNMAASHVAIIGLVSTILSNVALALSVNSVMVYEAAVVGVMRRSTIPMIRSMMSSLVGLTNQGSLYAGLSCIESVGAGVFSVAANRIYYATLATWAGEVFVIFAAIIVVALVLLIALNVMVANECKQNKLSENSCGNIQGEDVQ